MADENSGLRITLEFGGGAELLFNKIKKQQVTLPEKDKSWTIRSLLVWIKDNLLKERPELFIQGDNVVGWITSCKKGIPYSSFQRYTAASRL
ncbi:ubiquitin-related modifier 1 isoform X2 [Anabrus simplex]|uniref:ubiquitin-related modifier 1 isoform X2 n=1 Tax=Anabrus simplex TaxID=316456 RepID=UPI0035A2AFBD